MTQGIIAILIANFLGGALPPLLVKLGVREIPPLTFTVFRFVLATLFLLPFYLKNHKLKIPLINKWTLLNSLFFEGNVALFSIAIQFTSAIMSQLIYIFVPIIVGIWGVLFLEEKISGNELIGSIVAFAGAIFLLSE